MKKRLIYAGKQLEIAITGTGEKNNEFNLTTAEGAQIEYSVKGSAGSEQIFFSAPESTQFAGEYSGTVIFTVSIGEVLS